MIRLASSPVPHVKSLARTALMVLNSRNNMRKAQSCSSGAATPVTNGSPVHAGVDAVDAAAGPAPLAGALTANQPLDIAIPDWDDLFHAVEARLKAAVEMTPAQALASQPPGAAGEVQVVVLECLTALDQLHVALMHERQIHCQFEQVVSDAQAAATRALAGLVGIPPASLAIVGEPPLNDRLATLAASVTNEFGLKNGHLDAA